ncbi:MAG: hypothetical protein IT165_05465 [Bryobacterales bacterium]|nr:hypothetical protein [Bryobacterales bacterium]
MKARTLCFLFAGLGPALFPALAQDLSGILAGASRQAEKNAKIVGLRFNCDPSDCRVRPFETLVVQVLVDGEMTVSNGETRKGRLHRTPGQLKVSSANWGWVSKPFKFQGSDPGGYIDTGGGTFAGIFAKMAGDYIVADSFLYTAPETSGTYTLTDDTEGVTGEVKITVDANAPSRKKAEEVNFGPEDKSNEPYRPLVEHYAPMVAQETWWTPKADIPTRFDYDNDLLGDNNWDDLDKGTSQAYVHYAVMETSTHWFVIYNLFHPRDYSDKCVAGSCHENDNEGIILTIQKDGSQFGKLQVMETLAHDNIYSFVNDNSIRNGVHDIDGKIDFHEGSHPIIFVESGGHGIYGPSDAKTSRYNAGKGEFTAGTGITLIYKGVAERPKHANDRGVGYELLPILTKWWPYVESNAQNQRMFDEFGPYEPFGNRPGIKVGKIGHTFYGRKEAANKAKPFWGWHDNRTLKAGVLAPGEWGLDPAYGVTRDLTFPSNMAFSLDYTNNPYLGIVGDTQAAAGGAVITAGTPVAGAPGATAPFAQPSSAPAPSTGATVLPNIGAPAPSGTAPSEGWVEITATVDASVIFHVWGETVSPEILSGQAVKDQQQQFSGPIPSGFGVEWSVEKKSGRGNVKIAEEPSDANGQTLKVRVDDSKGGADRYVFRITWKRR